VAGEELLYFVIIFFIIFLGFAMSFHMAFAGDVRMPHPCIIF
jgi:hypothetical protein